MNSVTAIDISNFFRLITFFQIYEISCKIEKTGEVEDTFDVEQNKKDVEIDAGIKTQFKIEKYWGDVTKDISTLTPLTKTIPMGPNSNSNDRVLFKISSNHPEEYVHLEQCELSEEDENGNIINPETFIIDGCVVGDYRDIIDNSDRTVFANEDIFNMRPFLSGCKTKWHIKCKTASCMRGLESKNRKAFDEHCSISDTCPRSYYSSSTITPSAAENEEVTKTLQIRPSTTLLLKRLWSILALMLTLKILHIVVSHY